MTAAASPDGHLARLLQRVRPGEALLQRRQPSLFEQLPPDAAGSALDERVPAMVPTPRCAEFTASRETPSQPLDGTPIDSPRQRPPTAAPAAQAPVPGQALPPTRDTLRIDASLRAASRPAGQAAPAESAPAHEGSPRSRREEPAWAPAQAAREPAPPPLAHPTTPARPATPLLQPTHTAAVASSSPPPATARAAAMQPSRRQQAPQALPPRALPPLQVTIGRIEVRAAVAPPAVAGQGSARATPRLGLEQYLRERHGGGR